MRILFTSDPEVPVPPKLYGGIQRILAELISFCRNQNISVALLANKDSTIECDQLFSWPGSRSQNIYDSAVNILKLNSAIKLFKPDLVHSFGRLLYLLPTLNSNIPKIMSYQREPSTRTTNMALKVGRHIYFTACSDYIKNLGLRVGGSWRTVYNFVNINKYNFSPSIPSDAPLVFLSRLDRVKGADIAIKVAKQSGRKLILAGNHAETGPEAEYFNTLIKPQIDNKQIEYVGPVDDQQKNQLLGQAAALLLPIQWDEPFGIVFVEALACGTPVICSTRGAAPEIIRNGIDGFLADDEQALLNAITNIEEIDRQNCRKRVEESFSHELICSQYIDLYRELLS